MPGRDLACRSDADPGTHDLDRFHLVMDVIDRVPGLASSAGHVRQLMEDNRIRCRAYTREFGEDAPEITDWRWTG